MTASAPPPGRARCAVPFCRRTAPTAEGFRDLAFLCAGHWRGLSSATRAAWREQRRLVRRTPDPSWHHPPGSAARLVRLGLERRHVALWEATRAEAIEAAMGTGGSMQNDSGNPIPESFCYPRGPGSVA